LHIEGRRFEAEGEYQRALRALNQMGRSDSADAGAILDCLAALLRAGQSGSMKLG
jgi:hypothetical protein